MKRRVEEKRCASLEDSREYEKMMVCGALGLLKGHRVFFFFFLPVVRGGAGPRGF
jgi:sensor domain CHASE-containing protein